MTGDGARREAARARLVGLVGLPVATREGSAQTGVHAGSDAGWLPLAPVRGLPSADSVAVPAADFAAVPAAAPAAAPAPDAVAEPTDQASERAAEAASVRERALLSAVATYTAAHGHPLDHPAMDTPAGERRWAMPGRVAAAAIVVLVLLVGLVVARAHGRPAPPTVPLGAAVLDRTGDAGPEPSGRAPTDGRTPAGPAVADDTATTATADPTGAGTAPGTVVVHVVGQVVSGGVVELPQGSRVADAVMAAGGPAAEADLTALNLARVLGDGEQIVVPRLGDALPPQQHGAPGPAAATPAAPAGTAAGAPLDLNAADAAALDALPGIGPVLAGRIVQWRATHGRFTSIDELSEVTGIGPTLLEGMRDLVHV